MVNSHGDRCCPVIVGLVSSYKWPRWSCKLGLLITTLPQTSRYLLRRYVLVCFGGPNTFSGGWIYFIGDVLRLVPW